MQIHDTLALIPAWNEATKISGVIRSLPEGMPALVVDDGSSDTTPDIARSAGAEVIEHGMNKGKGEALMTGFAWALASGYPAVLTLDADGQHDPSEAGLFIDAYNQDQADLIIGRRAFDEIPFPRNLANMFSSWLLSKILRQRISDNQSGYRLYSQAFLKALEIRRAGFEFEVDVILQAIQKGFQIGWVDIRTIYAHDIRSHFHPLRDTYKFFSVAWYAFWSNRTSKPG